MTKLADSFASILGVVAACLLSVATASTCSVALADVTPLSTAKPDCHLERLNFLCVYTIACPQATPKCDYTTLTETACGCE